MAVTVSLKQMKDLIFELDTAMTNLSIVTGATESELAMVDKRATELTTTLGALKGEVINSITEFARAGYDLSESMFLAEKATMAANVGFTELDKITTFIIAGLKSFQLEAEGATRIMDVLFQVSNKTAIDLEGIGEAFLRSANTLKVAGATLEESAALISAANESIQDPAKVGTALKTIASRLRGIGDEGEIVPTLAKDFKAVGVEIQNAEHQRRSENSADLQRQAHDPSRAGCANVSPTSSIIIGAIAGVLVVFSVLFFDRIVDGINGATVKVSKFFIYPIIN